MLRVCYFSRKGAKPQWVYSRLRGRASPFAKATAGQAEHDLRNLKPQTSSSRSPITIYCFLLTTLCRKLCRKPCRYLQPGISTKFAIRFTTKLRGLQLNHSLLTTYFPTDPRLSTSNSEGPPRQEQSRECDQRFAE